MSTISNELEQAVSDALMTARNDALDAAANLCDELNRQAVPASRYGGSIRALKKTLVGN